MKRFDNAYPLAIASYNGGPHNVSAWLQGTSADMPMDAFVEHIPFKETRGYVQSVSSHYATYLSLYAPEGTELTIPPHPGGDHPEVVDF
jgi:soluble lytic murein transglycosylase